MPEIAETGRVGGTLSGHIRWRGRVVLNDNVRVPHGARLTIEHGTRIEAERGEEDAPWYLGERSAFGERLTLGRRARRHLVVAGRLDVAGSPDRPVSFDGPGWGGILVLGSGRAFLRRSDLASNEGGVGVLCLDFGRLRASSCRFAGGEGGVACGAFASASLRDCAFTDAAKAAAWIHDDAVAAMTGCRIENSRTGLLVQGLGRLRLRDNRIAGNRRGALISDGARVRGSASTWERNDAAISLQGRARLSLSGDRFRDNALGLECLGRSRAELEGAVADENGIAAWAQDEASLSADNSTFTRNEVGIRGSRRARLRVGAGVFDGQRRAGLLVEERAAAVLRDASFQGNLNGLMALHGSELDALRCRLSGSRDTGVWLDHRARAHIRDCEFHGNFKDTQVETKPSYP